MIEPDHHMAEGNGLEMKDSGEQGKEAGEAAAGNLNHPVHHTAGGPQAEGDSRQEKPQRACGRGPCVADNEKQTVHGGEENGSRKHGITQHQASGAGAVATVHWKYPLEQFKTLSKGRPLPTG
ncbi:hypothetical protein GHYDROH2_09910 [Geobacter hydrogenophilus]|uniref:Uncharacterized protein n=1 Tax=Geobacter hydrogenophilus TaxID=40983 RepID=A0A9W6FYN4_9BACT|nr:hypothetical protein GHYDROH2_09910 [Geobacter hydrogenophilus]